MYKQKLNNKGFTLLESMICFVLLGILLVAAGQIIASTTNVYYQTKSISYGLQASQAIVTEIRGEIEKAQLLKVHPEDATDDACINIINSKKGIEFVDLNGNRKTYDFYELSSVSENTLTENSQPIYDSTTYLVLSSAGNISNEAQYTKDNIGMGYSVKEITFSKPTQAYSDASTKFTDSPVIQVDITVISEKYGEYSCTEFISLYNFSYADKDKIKEK